MEDNLKHEDLLIKLRGKLNEEKIKLWEPPYLGADEFTQSFQQLAKKYSSDLSLDEHLVLTALHELQLRSMERVKANEEFKDSGLATFRIKVTIPKEKPKSLKIQRTLDVLGSDLLNAVANEIGVKESRLKLISNGKLVKSNLTLNEQNVKNGTQLMALVLDASPDEVKKEDKLYMEMKTIRDDATMLSEYVSQLADYDEYIKLEDQSGKPVEMPPGEKKSLLVGLALHERGRATMKQKDYSLALVLLLEADRTFNECRSSLLQTVDNWGLLQLDIAWCYAGLRSVATAADAVLRLEDAERALSDIYGPEQSRVFEVKGNAANERVLLMRLCLLKGIVAFHQNRRTDAKALFEKAETELNRLRVDESAVGRLMELGWSRAQARVGLRGAGGDPDRAHLELTARADQRDQYRRDRQLRLQRTCSDGTALDEGLVRQLEAQGFARPLAIMALRRNNNDLQAALRHLSSLRDHPQLLCEMLDQVVDSDSDSPSEPDHKLIAELEAMGYPGDVVRRALLAGHNEMHAALDLLLAGPAVTSESKVSGQEGEEGQEGGNPSTSTAETSRTMLKKEWERKRECERALERLSSAIHEDEEDYLDTSLVEEEQYLAEYKSLL